MIELKKLHLDGWLSYDKASFNLNGHGITLIRGKIGSGKSAIFEAVFYLLFGKTLRDKDSVNSLVNKLLDNGYEIALELRINGKEYKIQEIRNRPKKGLYFYKEGEPVVGSSDPETRKLILAELGISASEFKAIAFFGQRQAQIMLSGTPGERAAAIVDIFGLDKYDTAIKSCNERIKLTNAQAEEHTEAISRSEQEIASLQSMIADVADDEVGIEAKTNRLKKTNEAIATIEEKLSKINLVAEKNRDILSKAAAYKKQSEQAASLAGEVAELRAQLVNNEWPRYTAAELTEHIQTLRDEKNNYSTILEQSRREIKTVEEYENICPVNQKTCPVNVPLNFKDKTVSACEQNIEAATKRITIIDRRLTDAKDNLQQAEKREKIIENTRAKSGLLKRIALQQDFDVDEAKAQIEKCELAIAKGNVKLREHQELQHSLKVDLAVYEKSQGLRKTVNSSIKKQEKKLRDSQDALEEINTEAKYLAAALSVIKKAKMYRIDTVLQLLNKYVAETLDKISEGVYKAQFVSQQSDASGSRLLDKIGILVSDPYKEIPIELCSGGQTTEVGLAVLLGTWKAAHALSTKSVTSLWLDEVFGSLDEEAVDRVFESVVDVADELGANSVKIISHRELDSRLLQHVWYIDLEDGLSTVRME